MTAVYAILFAAILTIVLLLMVRHITKLKNERRKVEEERDGMARLLTENPNPMMRIDGHFNVLYANDAAKKVLDGLNVVKKGAFRFDDTKWCKLITNTLHHAQVNSMEIPANDRMFHFTVVAVTDYVNLYGYDITERKLSEIALGHELNKILGILDNMQDCVVIVRGDLTVIYANNAAIGDFGRFENKKCYVYLNGLEESCSWCESRNVFLGKTVRREFVSQKTGKTYDVMETPLTNLDGSTSSLGIFRDITNSKRLADRLLLFSQAIEETIDNVHIFDMTGKIIYANKAAASMTGYSNDESLGMDVVNLVEDGFLAENIIIPSVYVKGVWEGEVLCKRKDGSNYLGWLAANLVNNPDGKPFAMIGTLRDITERKKIEETCRTAEANMTALTNAIMESVCLIDTNGVLVSVNDTFATRFSMDGLKRGSDIVGMKFVDIVPPDIYQTKKEYFDTVINTGQPVTFETLRGEAVCLTNMYPVFNDERKVGGIAVYSSDITHLKRYENHLLQSIKEKETLMREIHHRVKNNLQIVAGLIGLQMNHITDKAYIAIFNETMCRIKSIALVHDKLYGSKGLAEVDLKKYILSLSKELFMAFGIDAKGVELALEMEDVVIGVDIAVPCGLIINELFTNILKYAFPDKSMGKITISIQSKGDGNLEMTISDNGIGFPEDTDFKNTKSLGLHIVNILVKQINGTIELDRTHGSRFTINFANPNKEL